MSLKQNHHRLIPTLGVSAIIIILLAVSSALPQQNQPVNSETNSSGTENTLLNAEILDASLALGTEFLLQNQLSEGNFHYEYNFEEQKQSTEDNQVRQAGALWGIALIHKFRPTEKTKDAVIRGINFFHDISRTDESGNRFIVYPGENEGKSGTVALVALAIIELLASANGPTDRTVYEQELDQYIRYLLSIRQENGLFFSSYGNDNGKGIRPPSPYFDGEILLALTKYAQNAKYMRLKSLILESAETMYDTHVTRARTKEADSTETKGFYQWGSMSFYEINALGWDPENIYANRVIELAHWMIDEHRVLDRSKNTAYAYEGIITAWELAKQTGDTASQVKFGNVVNRGLYRLSTWQVNSPIQNVFLKIASATQTQADPFASGGVMNEKNGKTLRIDVTQHQMHAVILARRFLLL